MRQIPNPKLTLLPLQQGLTVQTLSQGINALRAKSASFMQVNPVFQTEDAEMTITDEFFEARTSTAPAPLVSPSSWSSIPHVTNTGMLHPSLSRRKRDHYGAVPSAESGPEKRLGRDDGRHGAFARRCILAATATGQTRRRVPLENSSVPASSCCPWMRSGVDGGEDEEHAVALVEHHALALSCRTEPHRPTCSAPMVS